MTELPTVLPGSFELRPSPAGLPDPNLSPPTIAEPGDPFATLRVLHLVARIERGRPIRVDDLLDSLNARYLDWLFDRAVVTHALVQLQANWLADYRNSSGIILETGSYGPTITIEDSPRVDPWLVRQVRRELAAGEELLRSFSRRDRVHAEG